MERKLDPIAQAYQEMPKNWHEKLGSKGKYLVGLMTYILATTLIDKSGLNPDDIGPHLIGAFLYTIGSIADMISTARALDVGKKAQEIGIKVTVEERNPFVRRVRSSFELYHNPRTWLLNGLGLIVGLANAPTGITVGFARGYVAMNNFRLGKRTNRMVELALPEEPSN